MKKQPVKTIAATILMLCLTSPEALASEDGGDVDERTWTSRGTNNTIFIGSETYQEISPPADSPRTTDTPGQAGAPAENEATDSADSAPAVAYADETTQQAPAPGACTVWDPLTDDKPPVAICTALPQPDDSAPDDPAPAEPASVPPAPRPLTVTARDVATAIADGSGLTRQPPGPTLLITKPLIVYTNPAPQNLTTTIATTTVDIEATPIAYTWDWGDGTTTTTTEPGAPWPNPTLTHRYTRTATNITTTLTTTWTARYRPAGTAQWHHVNGTITTTETSTPYTITRTLTYLTDNAEEAHNH